ncbi:MAG: hypothetical protein ACM3XZ_01580 [Betaproteobacteria bacterium]
MKKAIVLSLVLVMALSMSAFAADIKTTGKVWWSLEKAGDADPTYDNGYRLQFDGTLDENSGFQIRLEPGKIDTDTDTVADTAVGALVKRANYWVNFEGAGKLTVGQQYVNFTGLDVGYTASYLSKGFTGLAFAPALPEGAKGVAFYDPINEEFGGQASFAVAGATIYGGASKKSEEDDAAFAVGASYAVIPDQLTVYGEYDKKGEAEEGDEKYLGAKFSAGGFDVYGEYTLDAKDFTIDAYYTVKNVELNLTYTMPDTGDSTLYFGTTMYF